MGRLLRIDGRYMTSERDEFFYHEPMAHAAALAHPAPRSALVLGGGDGGCSEELLKHPGTERLVLAELDAEVVRPRASTCTPSIAAPSKMRGWPCASATDWPIWRPRRPTRRASAST